MSTHTDLIDEVNDAMDARDHDDAEWMLRGWRAGVDSCGMKWSTTEADDHTMARFGADRPMCCGVLLDWSAK